MTHRLGATALAAAAVGPVASSAASAAPRASAEGLRLIDFATRLVSPEQIKGAGVGGGLVYVSELLAPDFGQWELPR